MKKIISAIFFVSFILILSCSTSHVQSERWEGFTGDRMRVVISEFFMPDEKNPNAVPEKLIKERVSQRASLLLASYVNINLPRDKVSPESDALFNKLINEALASPAIIFSECHENNYCTIITEFDIAPVNRKLEESGNDSSKNR
jgi:hypothetical protein